MRWFYWISIIITLLFFLISVIIFIFLTIIRARVWEYFKKRKK